MNKVRIKICGITRAEDAQAAARCGADAIGLVFAERSKRQISMAQAQAICQDLPPWLSVVGLFMQHEADFVNEAIRQLPLNWLQFHGSESESFCQSFQRPYIKAVAMAGRQNANLTEYPSATALLLDAHAPGQAGGSGHTFDWHRFTPPKRPWILAGGLNVENVSDALALLNPPALDVSSGVESAPGIKDDKLMQQFIKVTQHG